MNFFEAQDQMVHDLLRHYSKYGIEFRTTELLSTGEYQIEATMRSAAQVLVNRYSLSFADVSQLTQGSICQLITAMGDELIDWATHPNVRDVPNYAEQRRLPE